MADNGDNEAIEVVLCGSMAGVLGGHLPADRQTLDCDVIASQPADRFPAIAAAAATVAGNLGLGPQWLNNESRVFAWRLPAGWKQRLQPIGRFGPLTVTAVSRRDLMALKLMGAAQRPQDQAERCKTLAGCGSAKITSRRVGFSPRSDGWGSFSRLARHDFCSTSPTQAFCSVLPKDLDAMKPKPDEAAFLRRYLDQSEAESLDRASYDRERALLDELAGAP